MISPKIENDRDKNKKFWTHIGHSKQDGTGVAPLLGEDGRLGDDPVGKAEILNGQFASVFSQIAPLGLAQSAARTLRNIPSLPVNNLYTSPHSTQANVR
jgi:hypothetical protein